MIDDHDDLRQHRTDCRIHAREAEIVLGQALVDHRALLVEDHPRHDDRADVRCDQQQVLLVSERLVTEDAFADDAFAWTDERRRPPG